MCCFAYNTDMKSNNPAEATNKSGVEVYRSISQMNTTQNKFYNEDVYPLKLPENQILSQESGKSHLQDSTAVVSLKKAVQMQRAQKHDKARKLFHHALLLCPSHPDVLAAYGEFLENVEKDIIQADYFYQRALSVCPQHSKAAENVKRTQPLVTEIDKKQMATINMKRILLNNVPSNELLEKVQKEECFEHIHNTVAIEGNTLTLAETKMFIETGIPVPGKSATEHNEVLGIVDALQFVNDSLLPRIGPITISDILNIHKIVLNRVDPVNAGTFRKIQVYVGVHTPPPASVVCSLMQGFCNWLNSNPSKLHPVKLAALAHQKIAFIHPFVDGNGRTSRLLMNLILMRAGYPEIIIRKQDSELYFKNLQISNEVDVRPFVRFIAQYVEETLDAYYHVVKCGLSEISETLKL